MTTSGGSPIPGWYPDPYDANQLRYWDGVSWTDSVTPATGHPSSQAQPQPYGQQGAPSRPGSYAAPAGYVTPGYGPAGGGSGLGEVGAWLSETFSVTFSRFGQLALLLYAIPLVGVAVLVVLARSVFADVRFDIDGETVDGFEVASLVPIALIALVVAILWIVCWLASYDVLDAAHRGRPRSLGASLLAGANQLPRAILWWLVLAVVGIVGYGLLFAVPLILGLTVSEGFYALFFVSFIVVIPLAIWLWVKLALFGPALAVAPSGDNPIGVSWRLSNGRFWGFFGRLLLLAVIGWLVGFAGGVLFQIVVSVAVESGLGFAIDPVSGEPLIDGEPISDVDAFTIGDLLPSSGVLIAFVALDGLIRAAYQMLFVGGTAALYVRAGGPSDNDG